MALMLPSLYFSGLSHASSEDWEVASTPVAGVPLDSLQRTRSVSLVFRVPANEQWTRIRDSWGDPGYVIVGRSPDPSESVLSWNSLGLQVTGTTGLGALDMVPAGATQNSARSNDTGLAFRPKPGVRVRLDVTVRPSVTLPAGELIVAPNWDSNGEARAWGMGVRLERPSVSQTRSSLGYWTSRRCGRCRELADRLTGIASDGGLPADERREMGGRARRIHAPARC
jgi:hypothetical protein